MNDYLADLGAPFPHSSIHWRVGRTSKDKTMCVPLAYLNARDVMNRLDEVIGPEYWQDAYQETSKRLLCTLSLRIDGHWISKTDGAGDSNMEGEKGGISDAFKRAAVKWNIGRYLYNCRDVWVPLVDGRKLPDNFGQSDILKSAESPFTSPRQRKQCVDYIREAIGSANGHMIKEAVDELTQEQHMDIWRQFASNERSAIKRLMQEIASK